MMILWIPFVMLLMQPQMMINGQETCPVCPDGSSTIPDDKLDVVVSEGEGENDTFTCADFAYFAGFLNEGTEDCAGIHAVTTLFCGCPVVQTTPEGKCPLCAAGTILTEEQLNTVLSDEGDGFLVTCTALVVSSQNIDEDSDDCKNTQLLGETFCGCEPSDVSEGRCTLCSDGSTPPDELLDVVIPDFGDEGITCRQILQTASFIGSSDGSQECSDLHLVGTVYCGCPPLVPDEDSCTLCNDGSSPPEGTKYLGNDDGNDLTCDFANNILISSYTVDTAFCDAAQAIVGPLCGCPSPEDVSDICRICGPPGTPLPDPKRVVRLPSVGSPSRDACFLKEIDLASEIAFEEGCDGPYKEAAAAACCGCADSDSGPTVEMIEKAKGRKTCSWLSEQASNVIDLHCSNIGRVRRGCRAVCDTCRPNGPCEDKDDSFTFQAMSSTMQSCKWLSRKTNAKKRKICKMSPDARESCGLSCDSCP